MHQRRCPDLPPDVLREISGRLHHVVDFVRFHAVCKTWRDSHDTTATKQPSLFPWLLSTNMDKYDLKFRCVFSRTSYHSSPPSDKRTWVASADGTAVWYMADGPCPSLHDPLTGAAIAHLPAFPDKWEKGQPFGLYCCLFGTRFGLCGIVYSDGAIFLYGLSQADAEDTPTFRAALLRPGDTTWTVVERTLVYTRHFFAAYHRGKILLIVGPNLSHIVTPGEDIDFNDVPVPWPSMLGESEKYCYEYGYALMSTLTFIWSSSLD
ncbi:hypothetical protein VPH35_064077 [Triticum aestivum]|uniref:F-box domain-containing protein n=1 Tax=Aegilops tauschii TaxID=37682 RepID=M8CRM0_AEGTA